MRHINTVNSAPTRKVREPGQNVFLSLMPVCGNNNGNGLQMSGGSCERHYDRSAITESSKKQTDGVQSHGSNTFNTGGATKHPAHKTRRY